MQETTLIKYLREKNRVITMINDIYGAEIPADASVEFCKDIKGTLPWLCNALVCRVANKVIVIMEEKFRIAHTSVVSMMRYFQHALNGIKNVDLGKLDVYYIILDGASKASAEPEPDLKFIQNGYGIISVANTHVDVFEITYNEDMMPYALEKCEILRDYAAWALCGRTIMERDHIPYAAYNELHEWAAQAAHGKKGFEPYAFGEHGDTTSEAFAEWKMEKFIQAARNEAYKIGFDEMHRRIEEARQSNKPARIKLYPNVGDAFYVELPDQFKDASDGAVETWMDEYLETRLLEHYERL